MRAQRTRILALTAAVIVVILAVAALLVWRQEHRLPFKVNKGGTAGRTHDESYTGGPHPPPERRKHGRGPASVEPVDDEALLTASISRLEKGHLAYSTPEKMKTGETQHVTASIAGEKVSVAALKANVPSGKDRSVESVATPVSTKMKMTLKSADFDITPLSSEEQIVAGDTPTTWEWDIVPKHSGKLRLHLAALVEIKQLSKDFATVDREITVQVDPLDATEKFVQTNWQWIIATLTALGGAAWKLIRDRKKKAEIPPPPAAGAANA